MGARGGVGLTSRWLLQLGAGVFYDKREAGRSPTHAMASSLVISLSLGTKVYLRDPLPDSLVPFLRVLGSVGVTRVGSDCCAVWGRSYGAFAGGGATYFLGERLGLGVEVGLRWDESSDNLERRRNVSGLVAVLVTLRLGTDTPSEAPPPPVAERRRRPIAPVDAPLEAAPTTTAPAADELRPSPPPSPTR